MSTGWIGVDLDGTLAVYDRWRGMTHIGAPIPAMVARVKRWLGEGIEVRIFTARVAHDSEGAARRVIEAWCNKHLGLVVPITNVKDFGMVELWDDRAIQVERNTGRRMDGHPEPPGSPSL